jgi:hypothetical protein
LAVFLVSNSFSDIVPSLFASKSLNELGLPAALKTELNTTTLKSVINFFETLIISPY